jgi:hypothetical protein
MLLPNAPNTGENFLFIPFNDGIGYPAIIYFGEDTDNHTISWEWVKFSSSNLIHKLDSKFLPDLNFVPNGIIDDEEDSLAIGPDAKAESNALAINGYAANESLAIGHGSYAKSQGLHINYGYNGVSGSSKWYTRDGNYIKFTYGGFDVEPSGAAVSVHYPIKIYSRYLQNNPENLEYVIINGTWYKEKEENGTKYFKI